MTIRKIKLPYISKLEAYQSLTDLKDKDLWEIMGVSKSYFYNVIKKGRMPGALVCKRAEERLHIKFKASDFEWRNTLKTGE